WAAVLLANDVIDLAAVESVLLGDQAILAECLGPRGHPAPQVRRDIGDRHDGYPAARRGRARAFARRIRCSICRYWFSSAASSGDKDVVFWRRIRSATRIFVSSEGRKSMTPWGVVPAARKSTNSSYARIMLP